MTTNSRVLTWVGGLKLAAQNPWTGVGPGHFVHNIGEVAPEYANHTAHNVFVSAAAETGWTGALLLAGLMLGSLFRAAYVALTFQQLSALAVVAGTVAYIVLGMFLSFTFLGVGYFVMGLCLADEARQRRRLVTM